jgi:hypothetical protein
MRLNICHKKLSLYSNYPPMSWQDIVLSVVSVVFSIALIPQIIDGYKYKRGGINILTSMPTFTGLYVISFVYYTLSLYFSSFVSIFMGTLWLILFIQRVIYKK